MVEVDHTLGSSLQRVDAPESTAAIRAAENAKGAAEASAEAAQSKVEELRGALEESHQRGERLERDLHAARWHPDVSADRGSELCELRYELRESVKEAKELQARAEWRASAADKAQAQLQSQIETERDARSSLEYDLESTSIELEGLRCGLRSAKEELSQRSAELSLLKLSKAVRGENRSLAAEREERERERRQMGREKRGADEALQACRVELGLVQLMQQQRVAAELQRCVGETHREAKAVKAENESMRGKLEAAEEQGEYLTALEAAANQMALLADEANQAHQQEIDTQAAALATAETAREDAESALLGLRVEMDALRCY